MSSPRGTAQSLELDSQNVWTDETLPGQVTLCRGCLMPWPPALLGPLCHPMTVMSFDWPLMLIRRCLPVHSTWVDS